MLCSVLCGRAVRKDNRTPQLSGRRIEMQNNASGGGEPANYTMPHERLLIKPIRPHLPAHVPMLNNRSHQCCYPHARHRVTSQSSAVPSYSPRQPR